MNGRLLVVAAMMLTLALLAAAAPATAKVVGENLDDLPPGCTEISEEIDVTVQGGRRFAEPFPGAVFTFDERVFDWPTCSRVTVTFVNEDDIRHQYMVHGTWPDGFFQIEVDGPGEDTGTFIVGPRQGTLLIHCGVPQHQQKGMKAELRIDGGSGHIPNILGVSGLPEDRQTEDSPAQPPLAALLGLIAILALLIHRPPERNRR